MTIHTPNLPALIDSLADTPQPGQWTEFDRPRQVAFLEALATGGSVRSAARAADVSSQTVYRARRGDAGFRLAWQGALLAARARAEDTLACRAIDGIEQEVLYHGEAIATRRRYSDRLLLAHLERLDRLTEDARTNAFADDFEAGLARFAAGEPQPAPNGGPAPVPSPAGADILSSGECHNRSKSNTSPGISAHLAGGDCDYDDDDDDDDWTDADIEAELASIEAEMADERPGDAPLLTGVGPDGVDRDPDGLVEEAQREAWLRGIPRWWLVVAPWPCGGEGRWHYAPGAAPDSGVGGMRERPVGSRLE